MNGMSNMNSSLKMNHNMYSVYEYTKQRQNRSSNKTLTDQQRDMPANCNMKDMHQNTATIKTASKTPGNKIDIIV